MVECDSLWQLGKRCAQDSVGCLANWLKPNHHQKNNESMMIKNGFSTKIDQCAQIGAHNERITSQIVA